MSWAIMLQAADLCSKFGFFDGDIVAEYCDENNVDLKGRYHKDVLLHLVKKYLEPKLDAGISLYEISSIHNPIRCEADCWDKCYMCDACAYVTHEQLLQAILETDEDPCE